MKENEKFIGKIKRHPTFGKVSVDRVHGKTRTKVEITCLERGEGWNEIKEKYVGVKTKSGWRRGQNREYGTKHIVHINELK